MSNEVFLVSLKRHFITAINFKIDENQNMKKNNHVHFAKD